MASETSGVRNLNGAVGRSREVHRVAVASAILAVWFVYTAVAARELDRRFSKTVCISLHAGSILVFTCVNLATIAAVAR